MPPLHRHQLVRPTDAGWRRLRERAWDDAARACLSHWAQRRLPLVVTRQPAHGDARALRHLALGLAAPLCWQRRRIALSVAHEEVASFDEFPRAESLVQSLPLRCRDAWRALCTALHALGATAHVYGSRGWQCLSGMDYVHPSSDVDLWTAVADARHADAVAATLQRFDRAGAPRLDGEPRRPRRRLARVAGVARRALSPAADEDAGRRRARARPDSAARRRAGPRPDSAARDRARP